MNRHSGRRVQLPVSLSTERLGSCPHCASDQSQSSHYLALEVSSSSASEPCTSAPGMAYTRLKHAVTGLWPGKVWRDQASRSASGRLENLAKLDSEGCLSAAERLLLESFLSRLPSSYATSDLSLQKVQAHRRLVERAEELKDGAVALQFEVKDDDDFAMDTTVSDSSCNSSAGGFSVVSSEGAPQVCRVEASFASRSHICRPELAAAMRQAGMSLLSLSVFHVAPRGSIGFASFRAFKDEFSQELLEDVFISLAEKRPPRRLMGLARSGDSQEPLISFLPRKCESDHASERGNSNGDSGRGSRFMRSPLSCHLRQRSASGADISGILQALSDGDKLALKSDMRKFILDPFKLELGPIIAMGSSGEVRRGQYEGQDVAVKVLKCRVRAKDSASVVAEFRREVLTLMACGECPHLLKFYGICVDIRNRMCIVTKFMEGGTLHSFLQARQSVPVPLPQLLSIATDVALAMDFLHKNGIIHRDLKSANVLLDRDGNAVVGDFGVAKLKGERGEMTKEVGTYRWMAPEAFGTSAWPVTNKSDVYSFGIVLWELVSLALPFQDYSPLQAAVAVTLNGLRPSIPDDCQPQLKELIERCWAKNPDDRPDFPSVLAALRAISASLSQQ